MAVTAAALGTPLASSGDATSYTTDSYTPSADTLLVAVVESSRTDSVQPSVPSLSGNGLTWSRVGTLELNRNTGSQFRRLTVWTAPAGASPSAGGLTADFGAETQRGCSIHVAELSGADNGSPVVQSNTGSGTSTSPTVSLSSAVTSGNATLAGMFIAETGDAISAVSPWVELSDTEHSGPNTGMQTQFVSAGEQTSNWSRTGTLAYEAFIIEVAASGGGGGASSVWHIFQSGSLVAADIFRASELSP